MWLELNVHIVRLGGLTPFFVQGKIGEGSPLFVPGMFIGRRLSRWLRGANSVPTSTLLLIGVPWYLVPCSIFIQVAEVSFQRGLDLV